MSDLFNEQAPQIKGSKPSLIPRVPAAVPKGEWVNYVRVRFKCTTGPAYGGSVMEIDGATPHDSLQDVLDLGQWLKQQLIYAGQQYFAQNTAQDRTYHLRLQNWTVDEGWYANNPPHRITLDELNQQMAITWDHRINDPGHVYRLNFETYAAPSWGAWVTSRILFTQDVLNAQSVEPFVMNQLQWFLNQLNLWVIGMPFDLDFKFKVNFSRVGGGHGGPSVG